MWEKIGNCFFNPIKKLDFFPYLKQFFNKGYTLYKYVITNKVFSSTIN